VPSRLIIVSGKGGVGKTTIAHAITKELCERGLKAFYTSFDQICPPEILKDGTPRFITSPEESSEIYIGMKLGSPLLAKWVMKAPFFKALFQVLPPLGHMILLGHYIKELEDNPDHYIVLDSPASGHAMSMMSSLTNFKEIFKLGVLVDDIDRMNNFLKTPGNTKVFVSAIPTEMSVEEGLDLQKFFINWGLTDTEIIINNSLDSEIVKGSNSPLSKKKLEIEKTILDCYFSKNLPLIPQVFSHDKKMILKDISNIISGIL
jgi:arsenite-transporting ATPase